MPAPVDAKKIKLEKNWFNHTTGYKYKVWFESTPLKTVFITNRDMVVHGVRRHENDRKYDPKYTVYLYSVTDTTLERTKEYDCTSIVHLKQTIDNIIRGIP